MIEKHVETLYIEITAKSGKKIVLGSLYTAPNTPASPFNDHIIKPLNYYVIQRRTREVTRKSFLDVILNNDLLPTITRPTRITQTTASLTDNIFVTKPLHHNFDSLILLNDMLDHLPTLTLLKQTKIVDKDPIFESHCLNNDKLGKIQHELYSIDWNGHLNSSDCNENFNVFCNKLRDTMDKHAPLKKVRISSKHRFCKPWMTTGIEEASRKM